MYRIAKICICRNQKTLGPNGIKTRKTPHRDDIARKRLLTGKLGAYETFAQPRDNLPRGIYSEMVPPSRDKPDTQNMNKMEGAPAHTTIPRVEKNKEKEKENMPNRLGPPIRLYRPPMPLKEKAQLRRAKNAVVANGVRGAEKEKGRKGRNR